MEYIRKIVVGDVHGCLSELQELLELVKYDSAQDRLIFVGDLVDRGPDPVGVVRFVRSLGVEVCLGNHEEKAIRFNKYEKRRVDTGEPNPMRPFGWKRRTEHEALTEEDQAWFSSLPLYIKLDNRWLITHAGFASDRPIADQDPRSIVRTRWVDKNTGEYSKAVRNPWNIPESAVYWTEKWTGPESVVYGHNVHDLKDVRIDAPVPGVLCYGIDTGCCFGGRLSALILKKGALPDIAQVAAKKEYAPLRHSRSED